MFIDTNNKLSLFWFGLVWLLTALYLKFWGSMFFFDNQNRLFCFMCYSIAIRWDSCQKFAIRAKNFQSAESKPELSPNEEVLLNSCLSCSLLWHRSHNTLLRCSSLLYTFSAQKVYIFLWEENECDPGRADRSGRALNTALLVRPHTAHSVSSGRSVRSSLEIIKALISCQIPQRHPSITQTLKPPSWMLISCRSQTGRKINSFCVLHIGLFDMILSDSRWKTANSLELLGQIHCKKCSNVSCPCYTC